MRHCIGKTNLVATTYFALQFFKKPNLMVLLVHLVVALNKYLQRCLSKSHWMLQMSNGIHYGSMMKFIIETEGYSLSTIHGDYKGGIRAVEWLTNSLWRYFNFEVGKFETCIVLCSRFLLDCKFQ